MGYRIFVLCLRQVLLNIKVAFQLSWMWIAIFMFILLSGYIFAGVFASSSSGGGFLITTFIFTLIFVVVLLFFVISAAVGWHRYVLLEEAPPIFKLVSDNWPIGSYLWKSIKIGLLVALIFVPLAYFFYGNLISFARSIANPVTNFGLFAFVFTAIFIPINILGMWLFLRLGLSLPAVAVGKRMSLVESFEITSGYGIQLLVTATLLAIFNNLPELVFGPVIQFVMGGGASALQQMLGLYSVIQIFSIIFDWVAFFVGVGILTVLYGHLCEERPI